MNEPKRYEAMGPEVIETPTGEFVLWQDYVELERRHQTIMDAIEKMGSLENIRRVEVSQPIVIDMAYENACMKGTINRLIEAGDALVEAYFFDSGWNSTHRKEFNELSEVVAWNEAKRSNPNSSQPNA